MKYLTRTALLALSLSAAGCFPDERLWWSPDGTQLAVLTPTGLRWSDPDGNLSDATCEDVKAAAWLSDGSGVVVLKQTETATWEAAKALGHVGRGAVEEDEARRALPIRRRVAILRLLRHGFENTTTGDG